MTAWTKPVGGFTWGITCVVLFVLLLVYSYSVPKSAAIVKSKSKRASLSKSFYFLACSTWLFILLETLMLLLGGVYWSEYHSISCCVLIYASYCLAFVARMLMYTVLLARIYTTYNESAFRYRKRSLIVAEVVVVLYSIANLILLPFTIENCGAECQEVKYWLPGLLVYVFGDIAIQLAALWAFTSPLRKMAKLAKQSKSKTDPMLLQVMVKMTVLTYVTVITSVLNVALILAIGSAMFIFMDAVINCVCLAFMFSYFTKAYNKLCCGVLCDVSAVTDDEVNIQMQTQ